MPKLTPEAVDSLMRDCLFAEGESNDGAIVVEGVVGRFGFHPGRIAANTDMIRELLEELPAPFQASSGGGWTFLNACEDRHGNQWTGLHQVMDHLFCLGIAAGKARWLLPRDLWAALPGGVPYVSVN